MGRFNFEFAGIRLFQIMKFNNDPRIPNIRNPDSNLQVALIGSIITYLISENKI